MPTCSFQKIDIILTCFFIGNLRLENQRQAKEFFSSEIHQWKSEVGSKCFFHQKSNVRKLMSGRHVFFIRNPISGNTFFSLGIWQGKPNIGPTCIWKTDLWSTCFFQQKSYVGKQTLGQPVFFNGNATLENGRQTNIFFYRKSNVRNPTTAQCIIFIRTQTYENQHRQHHYFIGNPASENRCWANVFFHCKFDIK